MPGQTIEFFWDAASPYTYFASTQIEKIALGANATVEWKPFLIGMECAMPEGSGKTSRLAAFLLVFQCRKWHQRL